MRARNLWVLSIVVLAVALLVTVGYWGIPRGGRVLAQTSPPTEPALSFKCYVINQGTAPKEKVTLCDQFHDCPDGEQVTVREPQLLCTPAQKIREGSTPTEPPEFHLKCYNITPAGPPVNEKVTVFDQFFPEEPGDQVKVQTAQYLCESASKRE